MAYQELRGVEIFLHHSKFLKNSQLVKDIHYVEKQILFLKLHPIWRLEDGSVNPNEKLSLQISLASKVVSKHNKLENSF